MTQEPQLGAGRWSVWRTLGRGVAQAALGLIGGGLVAAAGAELGFRLFAGDPAGFGDIVARIGGILLGYPLGAAAGVWLGGRLFGPRGAFWAALAGAALGAGGIFMLFRLFPSGELILGWALLFLSSLAGALVGHGLSARARSRRARGTGPAGGAPQAERGKREGR